MALFTASVTGNWNAGPTWGNVGSTPGIDYPSEAGTDTFAANTSVVVTIPSDYLLAFSSGTIDGELVVDGKLKLSGNVTVNENADGLSANGAFTIDVNGFDIVQATGTTSGSSTPISLVGTSGARGTVMTSSTNGNISMSGTTNKMNGDHDIQYVDFSGLTAIDLAQNQVTAQNITFKNVSFTGYDTLTALAGVNLSANYTLDGIDLRDTVGATQRWDWGAAWSSDTGTRLFRNITMSDAGTLRNLGLVTATHGTKVTNLIVHNSTFANVTSGQIEFDGWFIDNIGSAGQQDIGLVGTTQNGYYYSDLVNAHPFGAYVGTNFINNVVECTAVGDGGDGIIFSSAFTGTMNVTNNIWLWASDGSCLNDLGTSSTGTVNFDHNTVVVNVQASNSGIDNFPFFIKSQATDWAGTVNCRSNIAHFVGGITAPTVAAAITLATTTADQIDVVDNNVLGLPDIWNEYNNVVITGKTYPEAGFGGSDIYVNPNFVDETRTLATWDASLGGAGTAANAITEMLKYNSTTFDSNYTISNAIAYVQAGFAPKEIQLKDAGHDSVTIGAIELFTPIAANDTGFLSRFGQLEIG